VGKQVIRDSDAGRSQVADRPLASVHYWDMDTGPVRFSVDIRFAHQIVQICAGKS
jgi:hypothetical protein